MGGCPPRYSPRPGGELLHPRRLPSCLLPGARPRRGAGEGSEQGQGGGERRREEGKTTHTKKKNRNPTPDHRCRRGAGQGSAPSRGTFPGRCVGKRLHAAPSTAVAGGSGAPRGAQGVGVKPGHRLAAGRCAARGGFAGSGARGLPPAAHPIPAPRLPRFPGSLRFLPRFSSNFLDLFVKAAAP